MSLLNDKPGIVAVSAAAAAIIGALALKYPDRALFDEHRENVPHPKGGLPILGTLLEVSKNKGRYFEYLLEVYEELDTMIFRSSSLTIARSFNTIDPKNIEYILKTNFQNYNKSIYFKNVFHDFLGNGIFNTDGENWRLQRRTASQIFHVKNFQTEFTSVFVDHIKVMSNHIFNKAVDNAEVLDFHDIMLRFTMDTFVEIAFGVKVDSLLKKVEFAESFDAIQFYNFQRLVFPLHKYTEKLKNLNVFGSGKSITQHMNVVNEFAYKVIKGRHAQEADQNEDAGQQINYKTDLLLRFMKANNDKDELYTDKELRDFMLNFIVAGRDTSAQTLSWFFFSVMQTPRVEKKLLEEINEFITDGIEEDTVQLYEAIQKMKYSHAVLNEVLRLYPAVPGNRKQALNDDVLPDGTIIRKGDEILMQPFCQGRSEKIWGPDAKYFKPERWINEEGNLIHAEPGAYVAFHLGPRLCLGQNMATLEILIAMSMLLKRYKFTRLRGHEVIFSYQVTLSMKDGMKVLTEKRQA